MKAGWETKRFGELCDLEVGRPLADHGWKTEGPYPVYGAEGETARTNKYYFDRPSIIVGRSGSPGKITLTEPRFWPLDTTYFVTFDEQEYDLHFLYHQLNMLDLPSLATGLHLDVHEIRKQIVRVPPLREQRRIAAILDQAFDNIATAAANVERSQQGARTLSGGRVPADLTQSLGSVYRRKLAALEELKRSLAYDAFDGKL